MTRRPNGGAVSERTTGPPISTSTDPSIRNGTLSNSHIVTLTR